MQYDCKYAEKLVKRLLTPFEINDVSGGFDDFSGAQDERYCSHTRSGGDYDQTCR